jgi:hypothetical protein
VEFKISDYMHDGLLRPLICAVPFVLFTVTIHQFPHTAAAPKGLSAFVAFLATSACLWRYGLLGTEREKLKAFHVSALVTRGFHGRRKTELD